MGLKIPVTGLPAMVMRVALAMLCVGAVAFQLRFLAALIKEAKRRPASAMIHFAKFKPFEQRGKLIEMKAQTPTRRVSAKTGKRMAL